MARSVKSNWRRLAAWTVVAPLLISACATGASAFDVEIGAPSALGGPFVGLGSAVEVTVKNTGRRAAKRVSLRCQYFDQSGAAVTVGAEYFYNLGSGRSYTNRVMIMTPGVVRGDCAVR
jgi:hypothetical protein